MVLDRPHHNSIGFKAKLKDWFGSSIAVLSFGKTGSSTLIRTLIVSGVPAYQVHSISSRHQRYYFSYPELYSKTLWVYWLKVSLWKLYVKFFGKRIIVILRRPFERNLSAFFEQAEINDNSFIGCSVDTKVDKFIKHGAHSAPREWCEEVLRDFLSLQPGDLDALCLDGYRTFSVGKIRLVIVCFERMDEWIAALKEGFDIQVDELYSANVSSAKVYAQDYDSVKSRVRSKISYGEEVCPYLSAAYSADC